ncbi:histidine phosphatase superfamily [Flagelloscypha sp. PMI_526]|nr:histidine phosphatase superfamily [Flagelloscypha sp. PMI_526]
MSNDEETAGLLPKHEQISAEDSELQSDTSIHKSRSFYRSFNLAHLAAAFLSGILACLFIQICSGPAVSQSLDHSSSSSADAALAPDWAGETRSHKFPPSRPTNANPKLFPTNVGHAGATPTGEEAFVIATAPAYPIHSGAPGLVVPSKMVKAKGGDVSEDFDMLRSWGNLSPWYSIPKGRFGLDSDPGTPETCRVTGLHFLHRHGARYPTSYAAYGGPANFATKLHDNAASWKATGDLEFLNDWTYQLGEEILTPFGRHQLYDLGYNLRLKYGHLLHNFSESRTIPVFRTESQDRMLHSALNFAIGFFGYPLEGKYQQSITIEADGFNNTLAPYKTCPNASIKEKSDRGKNMTEKWANIYLRDAEKRMEALLGGFDLTIEDIYEMQQMCAYETVALGYSKFCELFTEEEWKGFDYALDLGFWYNNAFGAPLAKALGLGYLQELVARLTHTPIAEYNSSTNSTLNTNPTTFPLDQALYVDATHEVVVLNVITALNLSSFAADGPLPTDHIPKNRKFRSSELAPFATNIQIQLLDCASPSLEGTQIRVIINDGVAPLTGVKGCPEQKDGMCALDTFVGSMKEIIGQTDWKYDCHTDWEIPDGWSTVTGDTPKNAL